MSASSFPALTERDDFRRDSHQRGVSLKVLGQPQSLVRCKQPIAGMKCLIALFVRNRHAYKSQFRADLRHAVDYVRQIRPRLSYVHGTNPDGSVNQNQQRARGHAADFANVKSVRYHTSCSCNVRVGK